MEFLVNFSIAKKNPKKINSIAFVLGSKNQNLRRQIF